MCATGFTYVEVGNERLVFCRNEDFNPRIIKKVIKKAFPERFKGLIFKKPIDELKIKSQEMYSGQFDYMVFPFEKEHDWKTFPFVALCLENEDDVECCGALCFSHDLLESAD
ncbi:MAG TPA: hypothetical protein DIT25_04530 [Candidatus Moranbacteria bacterium]|nr:hypothetical protein [Candidatus Moranbacteria bacterium]